METRITKFLILFFLSIIISGVIVFYFFNKSPAGLPFSKPTVKQSPSPQATFKQLVNCQDQREIIEEENKLYVACLGGVLVVDKNSGKVLDQISMADGLGNLTATALIKKNNDLYIGTQDGFTIFSLISRKAQKISVGQGLVNGANIILTLDGDILWVGTFDGLSRYDTNSGQITNFQNQLVDNATKFGVNDILVTEKAIWVNLRANAYTPGGVARLDKTTQKWERFGPAAFLPKTDQYSRLDFLHLAKADNKVIVGDFNNLWQTEDKPETSWIKLDSVVSQLEKGNNNLITSIFGDENNLDIIFNEKLYQYNPQNLSLVKIYPAENQAENVLTGTQYLSVIAKNQKLWVKPFDYNKNGWLTWLNLGNWQTGSVRLSGRPISVNAVVAAIDSRPIIIADQALWEFNLSDNNFAKLINISGEALFTFQPIPGTSKIFIYQQACGMGCPQPEFFLFDYENKKPTILIPPEEILNKIVENQAQQPYNFMPVIFEEFNNSSEFRFRLGYQGKEILRLRADDFSWKIEEDQNGISPDANLGLKIVCNPLFTYTGSNNQFKPSGCNKIIENDLYRWMVDISENQKNVIWQINKQTQEKTQLNLPLTEPQYSPFSSHFEIIINAVTEVNGVLWIGTNRGLVSFNPQTQKYRLFGTKEGLLSNDVSKFVVDKNILWVSTQAGFSKLEF